MESRKNIFVTGATGFLGGYVCKQLINQDRFNIHAIHRVDNEYGLLKKYKDKIIWHRGDLMDVPFLEEAVREANIIIHAAALVSFYKKDREKMLLINQHGTANLINLAIDYNIENFIHISSIAAIGRPPDEFKISEKTEWTDSDRNSNYALSKRLADLEVFRGFAEGLTGTILCPGVILGTGFWHRGTELFFKSVSAGLQWSPVGENSFVDVRDVTSAILQTLKSAPINDRLIISGHNASYKELLSQIAKLFGKRPPKNLVTKNLIRIASPFVYLVEWILGHSWPYPLGVLKNTSYKYRYDNEKSIQSLAMNYRPLSKTLEEIVSAWKQKQTDEPVLIG